jgi:hypothetical protein
MEPYNTLSFEEGDEKPLVLATQVVTGDRHYDFKLSAWHKKGYQWHFVIRSVKTSEEEHKEREMYFPFSALPKLREKMVKMLKDHDHEEASGLTKCRPSRNGPHEVRHRAN